LKTVDGAKAWQAARDAATALFRWSIGAMKNCGVIYARFKQQSEARRAVNNETPERRAVK